MNTFMSYEILGGSPVSFYVLPTRLRLDTYCPELAHAPLFQCSLYSCVLFVGSHGTISFSSSLYHPNAKIPALNNSITHL